MKAVFSDLDGTMLDFNTYSYKKALGGINILKKKDVPLVLVSSKTLTEMMPLHRELKLNWPFIFENGGGLAYPLNRDEYKEFRLDIIGDNIDQLKEELDFLRDTVKIPIKLLSDMDIDEIIERTGLSRKSAELVIKRITSIPFVPLEPVDIDINEANKILKERNILITKGGRFYHYSSLKANKGYAVRIVIQYLMIDLNIDKIESIGLGDSENDLPMLEVVDIPFLVRKHDGSAIEFNNKVVTVTRGIGPSGFTEAIKSVFKNRKRN